MFVDPDEAPYWSGMVLKSFAINGLIAVAAIAVSAISAELAVRALFPVYDPSGQVDFYRAPNDGLTLGALNTRLRQRKNTGDYDVTVTFNRYGLRDDKNLAESTPDDIFVVGDSFSFGWGVEAKDRYSDRLQAATGIRTYNIATPGNFDNYDRLLRYAVANGARIGNLVVGVCMENDLVDYGAAKAPVDGNFTFSLSTLKKFLTKHSGLYAMATTAIHGTPALKRLAVAIGLITQNLEGIPPAHYAESIITSSGERLRRLVQGYRATILIIPSRGLWTGPFTEDADRIHRAFIEALKRTGLAVVDLRTVFEETKDPLALHFPNDGHWNPRGHAMAARALAEAIPVQARPGAKMGTRP